DEALSFLLAHNTGVLATIASDGGPRARLVYYTCDDEFRVYFMSLANTRKAEDIANNAKAAFVVSETSLPRTLQIEGTVEDLTDTVGMDAHVTDL
ncbi:pyridoxamine 5'-phosphate oxidase family protein, partial [Enterococcus faecium]